MATDATGTPTPLGIPKFNTAVDAPSGNGFNAAMDAIDALISTAKKVAVKAAGTLIGTRTYINFVAGTNVSSVSAVDDVAGDKVDVTINAATQNPTVTKAGAGGGTRQGINFIEGTNVAITAADNGGSNRVDVTVSVPSPPGKEFDYVERTSQYTVTSSYAAFITGNTVAYSSADKYKITLVIPSISVTTNSGGQVNIRLYRGATLIGQIAQLYFSGSQTVTAPVTMTYFDRAPVDGNYAYSCQASYSGGATAAALAGGAGSTDYTPIQLQVSKV